MFQLFPWESKLFLSENRLYQIKKKLPVSKEFQTE